MVSIEKEQIAKQKEYNERRQYKKAYDPIKELESEGKEVSLLRQYDEKEKHEVGLD